MVRTPQLKIPQSPNAEIFFDPNRLEVGFRDSPRETQRRGGEKVLRVIVQFYGAVVDDRYFRPGSVITLGSGRKATFRYQIPGLPDPHTLLEYGMDQTLRLSLHRGFDGVLQVDQKLKRLPDVFGDLANEPKSVALKTGTRGCIEQGTLRIYFEETAEPEKAPPVALLSNLKNPYGWRWLIISLAVHALVALLFLVFSGKPSETKLDELSAPVKKIVLQPQKIEQYVPKVIVSSNLSRSPQGREGEGERAPGREGRRGRGVAGSGKRVSRKDISKTGILDVFAKGGKSGAFSDLLGGSGISSDIDKAFSRPGRYGLPGERELREGKGLQGSGTGGGGRTESIGQGLGTKGRGGGAKGTGLADFGTGKGDTIVSASLDDEEVFIVGNIPKEVIARIIQDHINQIRYCYERQLQVQPNIRGKVVTNFVIGLEGSVTSTGIRSSSLGSPPVETCIQGVLRRLKFPKPGGGIVEVIYPFTFRVAG